MTFGKVAIVVTLALSGSICSFPSYGQQAGQPATPNHAVQTANRRWRSLSRP